MPTLLGADPDAMRQGLREIAEVSAERERVVETLLALARQEAGMERPAMEPVEWIALPREPLRCLAEPIAAQQLTLQSVLAVVRHEHLVPRGCRGHSSRSGGKRGSCSHTCIAAADSGLLNR